LLEPVAKLGKYHILEQVGEGAMGVVYRALDPVLNRAVAIKVMSEGLAQDEALRARFLREAQAAGSLQHPNVVTIYDFGETDGHLFIAMEFVEGADLEHLLRHNAPLSLATKIDIVVDVLNGLSYAHRRGIVHRDIKPANVRVDEEGKARIMDFGVARLATSDMTKSGVMMGTPNYMAPEQINGGPITPSVDLFSVGALLYELLTSVKPFQGDTMHNVLFKIVTETPADIRHVKPDLPEALSDVVRKGIEKDPADRYRTASEMANALSVIRATLGPARVSKTLAQRVSARSEIDRSLRERSEAHTRAAAMRRWRMVAGIAAGIAALAMLNYWLVRGRLNPAVTPTSPAVTTASAPVDTLRPQPTAPVPVAIPVQTDTATRQPAAPPPREEKAAPRSEPAPQRAANPPAASPRRLATATARDTQRVRPAADTPRAAANPVQNAAPAAGTSGQTTSSQSTPVQPPVSPPPVVAAAETVRRAPPPEPENPRPALSAIVNEYARAIGTRQVAEVRRVYAGMTPQQQSAWESFFSSVRSMTATFDIASLDVNGNTAIARLNGVYEFVSRNGRSDRQQVSVDATLQREGDRWRLVSVR
jgi:serine/threonine-protein kinase